MPGYIIQYDESGQEGSDGGRAPQFESNAPGPSFIFKDILGITVRAKQHMTWEIHDWGSLDLGHRKENIEPDSQI